MPSSVALLDRVKFGLQWRWKRAAQSAHLDSDRAKWLRIVGSCVITGRFNFGYCPICEHSTIFVKEDRWLRDHYKCVYCLSIPRWRALIRVLELHFPDWRNLRILESSPDGACSAKLKAECLDYVASHYFPHQAPGTFKFGIRSENLECMTFADESFDLVISQDVFEHVLNPDKGFKEVARVLKKGGAHVFTVPYFYWKPTLVRAVEGLSGIRYLTEKDYHGNPIDEAGSLVVTEWGEDLIDFIFTHSGLVTTVHQLRDRSRGLEADFMEVFVSKKRLMPKTDAPTERTGNDCWNA